MPEITMPRLSDTMEEGTIARWLKKPGDKVSKGDILGEIETDKATMDLEAYESGVLEQILVQEGETVPIGQAIAVVGTGAGATQTSAPKQEQAVKAAQPSAASTPAAQPPPTVSSEREGVAAGGSGDGTAVKASPLARRMAEEHGIDLRQVSGTGPGGRIVRDDIEDLLEQGQTPSAPAPAPQPTAPPQAAPSPPPQPSAPPPETELVKLSRVQQLIARRLTESKQTIPHFYVSSEVDMTDILAMRQILNANVGEEGVKITVNDLIIKACALALEKFPEVNSSIKGDSFVRYKRINVGMAVDAPTGLVVPVIRDANTKGVRSIARESKALIAKARNNKLAPADLEGGTFSVSNLGMMDASNFIAVINPPQAAILAIAATRKQFVPIDGQPVIRDMMTMTMSSDHRIISGAAVARFLQEVKRLLQTPYSLLG
ncbi:MAG TPA: dihydrolipoamide acetyltransferase family protein [Ktedonobacteraceae bacterium]|nr:dihydrolipoamide acetyltransferase family protein [Ktedonobacteraceae bacterium]